MYHLYGYAHAAIRFFRSHDTYPSSLGVAALLIAPMPSDETGAASEDLRRLSAVVTALQLQAQT